MSLLKIPVPAELLQDIPHELSYAEEAGYTLIHCSYVSKQMYVNGGWINIWPTTWLFNEDETESIILLHALEVPLAPERYYFQKPGQLKRFTLVFPQLPKSWQLFSLKEQTATGDGFMVNRIERNNTGVYHIKLS